MKADVAAQLAEERRSLLEVAQFDREDRYMTIELPQSLLNLPEKEQSLLLRAGLYEAGRTRIRQLEAEIIEAEAEIERFETRYGMSFAQFECYQA